MPKISRAAGAAAVLALALGTALAAGACSGGRARASGTRLGWPRRTRPGAGAGAWIGPRAGAGPPPGRPAGARGRAGRDGGGLGGTGVRPAEASADSLNSAGYAASRGGTRFRLVRATFFVPYLNCALSKGAFSDEWVGLGGFVGKSVTVQQVGIQADCTAPDAAPTGPGTTCTRAARCCPGSGSGPATPSPPACSTTPTTNKFEPVADRQHHRRPVRGQPRVPGRDDLPGRSAEIISSAPTRGSGRHLVVKPLADYGAVSYAAIAITDRSGQRSGLRSAFWGATRIIQTEGSAPFRVVSRPTQIQANTFDTYWSREN